MKYFLIFLILIGFLIPSITFAQYLGDVEFYHLPLTVESKQYSVLAQSSINQFTDVMYDSKAHSLIFSTSLSGDFIDTYIITMNVQTFSEVLATDYAKNSDSMVVLVNGVDQPYKTIEDNEIISWIFYAPISSDEVELLPSSPRFGTGTYKFDKIPNESPKIYPPLKQDHVGISFDEIQCKETLVLIQKYDGSPACVTESTKTKLIERGWTSSSTTVMINSSFEQDRDRVYTDPRNVVIDLEKNNSVKWINNADYIVQVYDYENKSWSTGQIDPSMSDSIRFNSTGYYEFAVESANDRHFGEIIVISDDTNSLPIETRMKMGMSIVSNDLGKNPALIGVGIGDVNGGIVIDINQKELEKRDDAQSYYYDMYKEMIPFDVPITIEFTEPLKLLE